ncbi:MAG: N-acetylmuramoyl-L-alanine amidase [Oscillospiraceae bacterium]
MRKKKSHFGVVLLGIIAVALLIGAIFLMFNGTHLSLSIFDFTDKSVPAAAPPTFAGPIKAITLSGGGDMLLSQDQSRDAQKASIDTALDFAAQNGFDAVLWECTGADGSMYYRKYKGEAKPPKFISDCDTFLNKWDPLSYLCSSAATRGIGVFAYAEPQSISADAAASLEKHYPISGTYTLRTVLPEGAETGDITYNGVGGEPQLTAVSAATGFANAAKTYEAEGFGGFVFGEYSNLVSSLNTLSPYFALYNEAAPAAFTAFTPSAALTLTYPQDTTKPIYTDTCFLMGTSNPDLPLSLNASEVKRFGSSGLFGVLVNLELGDNPFVLSQGQGDVSFTITRKKSTYKPNPNAQDATVKAANGQMIEITTGIASALTDPSSDDNINETIKKGAKVRVTDSKRTKRGGKKTWAYRIASGDYILARNAKFTDATTASFSAASAQKVNNDELIPLGSGTPLCYTLKEDNTLTLTFYDTDIAADFAINGSEFILSSAVNPVEGGKAVVLTLNPDKPLWGWDIRYTNGNTELYLKASPKRSDNISKPLEGVRVLLDAGHGEDDAGAVGVGGLEAPLEKDVNLNVALSAKHYLEKLGATVLLTRSDNTFKTLDERLEAIGTESPDLFISVHHNSVELTVDANESRGTECYYFYKWHKSLADNLVNSVSAASGRENRSAKYGYYYVTRSTMAPSVLLETGFMVNPLEYESVTSPAAVSATGAAIAEAVLNLIPTI